MSTLRIKDAENTESLTTLITGSLGSRRMRIDGRSQRSILTVPTESRYSGHRVVTVRIGSDREFRTIETWERPIVPLDNSRNDRFFFIDAAYAYRSDRIANAVFGTPTYDWWVLASNDMYDNAQLVPGTTLRVVLPPMERIENISRRPF